MAIKEVPIAETIKELGLPNDSKFLGYVVHLPAEEEFLSKIIESKECIQKVFAKTPELAIVYSDHKKAIKDSKKCKQETLVCLLFDIGDQLIIIDIGS